MLRLFHRNSITNYNKLLARSFTLESNNPNLYKAIQATKAGAFLNVFLSLGKGIIGYSVGSTALIGDAFNNAADLMSDAVVYFSVLHSRTAASPENPWGKGKLEPLGALTVGGLLTVTGLGVGGSAVSSAVEIIMRNPEIVSEACNK